MFPQRVSLTTFGQPRTGNAAFASWANKRLEASALQAYRVTHWQDPVPHVPPRSAGYEHVGTEVFYDSSMIHYTVCNGSGEDPSCADSKIGYSLNDHIYYYGIHVGTDCD